MEMSVVPMIIMSILAGLLSTMNMWTTKFECMRLHLNDIYMVLLMTSWMILFHSIYYYNNNQTIIISLLCVIVFIYCIRKQVFVDDTQFMKGMIPHHDMAVFMSEKIKEKSRDKNVIVLADNIIKSQNEEIEFMVNLGY